mmetsp:Transcript_30896/g.95606  ORF Transcript_30896/g.95606 Transcript_30896/m.95606 type:complete len:91 (+) Transcript_30896:74-346(+)
MRVLIFPLDFCSRKGQTRQPKSSPRANLHRFLHRCCYRTGRVHGTAVANASAHELGEPRDGFLVRLCRACAAVELVRCEDADEGDLVPQQ